MTASSILAVFLAFILIALEFNIATAKLKLLYGEYDNLIVARCEAKCSLKSIKSECVKTCVTKGFNKPGECPHQSIISPFETACIKACRQDSQCPGLAKCCKHQCGITCQHPRNLLNATDVPEIPKDLIVREGRRKRTVYVEWKPGGISRKDDKIVYVLEERHHVGRKFNKEKLSQWLSCTQTSKLIQVLKNFAKPGTWYQFRVAAVNENGTKGYSENFFTFSTSNPKPPKAPQNMTVSPVWVGNNSLSVKLSWKPPQSDLPIHKYKVFWSRRLHGVRALDSVLVHQQTISRNQHEFLLNSLQPNSLYFLQVQALVQFGNDRLKGEKSGYILNTTLLSNITADGIVPLIEHTKIKSPRLEKIFWSQGELRARIVWKPRKTGQKYAVSWWTVSCDGKDNGFNHFKAAAATKAYRFDLYDLHFSCRYKVNVREIPTTKDSTFSEDTTLTFSTPSCITFKSSHKRTKCSNFS